MNNEIREKFSNILDETIIPVNAKKSVRAKKQAKIDSFLRVNTPASLFRYRTADIHYIDALEKGHISVTKPFKMSDDLDSLIMFDSAEIKRLFSKYFPSYKALEGWVKHNKGVSEVPKIALKSVPILVRVIFGLGLRFAKKPNATRSLQRSFKAVKANVGKQLNELKGQVYDELRHTRYIACFCESVSEYRMWDEYTNNHEGFALEYDFTETTPKGCAMFPVIYGTQYNATIFALHNIANDLPSQILKENGLSPFLQWYFKKKKFTNFFDELFYLKGYAYKGKKFAYEGEWRLLTSQTKKDSDCYSSVPFEAKAIYFGAKMKNETYERLNQIAIKRGLKRYKIIINDVNKTAIPIELE